MNTKKNVLRILLAFVVVALMFAMVACGNKNSNGKSGKGSGGSGSGSQQQGGNGGGNGGENGEEGGGGSQTGGEKTNVEKLEEAITGIINNVGPLLNTVAGIEEDSVVGADLGIGGYVNGEDGSEKHNFLISLAANASGDLEKQLPEAKFAVSVDNKDYFGLGYKGGNAYLTEGLNLINSTASSSNKIKMDVSYLEDGINNAAAFGMKNLAVAAAKLKEANIDLQALVIPLLSGKDEEGNDAGLMGINLYEILGELLEVTEGTNKMVIELPKDKVYKVTNGKADPNCVIGILEGLPAALINWAEVEDMINDYIDKAASAIGFIGLDETITFLSEGTTLRSLLETYEPSLKITAGYDNDGALNSLRLGIALNKTNPIEIGLNINLNTFSTAKTATISFSDRDFKAKSLTSTVKAQLGQKVTGELTLNLNTATAFASLDSEIVSATLKLNGKAAAKAGYNGQVLAFDASDAVTSDILEDSLQVKFYQDFGFNIKEGLKDWLEGIGQESGSNAPADDEEDEDVPMMVSLYNFVAGMFDADAWDGEDEPSFNDILDVAIVGINPMVSKYLADDIKLVDNEGAARDINDIIGDIVAVFEENEDSLFEAIDHDESEAWAVLFNDNGKNLIEFAGSFVKIPAIVDGKFSETETTNDFGDTFEEKAQFFKNYVVALFAMDDEDAAENYGEWNENVLRIFGVDTTNGFNESIFETVLGYSYSKIIDDGIVAYAGTEKDGGLNGYVGFCSANTEEEEVYVELGASIGFVNAYAASGVAVTDDNEADFEAFYADEAANENVFTMIYAALEYCFLAAE